MSTFLGKEGIIKIGSATVGEVRSFSITQTAATAEDTVMGDEWTTHKVTMKSWSGQLSCFWDNTDAGQNTLKLGAEVNLKLYPEGVAPDNEELSGAAIITSVETQLAHDGIIEASFAFQGTGPLIPGAIA